MESPERLQPKVDAAAAQKERSTVVFPYSDLDAAIEVVRGVHNAGGTACDIEQLAAQLNMEAKGGGFRMRVAGAQTFGLINYERGGRVVLTELGRQIINPGQEQQARVRSFLSVELFSKVYEEFKGGPLPPQAALERAVVSMGVGGKVADRARQALMRSARQAGFFDSASDRLVKPSIKAQEEGEQPPNRNQNKGGNGGGDGSGGDESLHPLIRGLLVTLPAPNKAWPVKDRMNWLIMANSIFKAIYPLSDTDTDEIKIDLGGSK